MIRLWLIAALVLIATGICQAAEDKSEGTLDRYLEAQRVAQRIPGMAVLVMHHGQVIKSRGYGLANVELSVAARPNTLFQTGSVGKSFVAMAVLLLVDEGRLKLDDPIVRTLPDAPAAWAPITVRQLLSHTAGLSDYPKGFNLRRDYSEQQLMQAIYSVPLSYAPGEGWAYSNTGYVTLGVLIHKVTGVFYGDFLQRRIFKPLQMTSTRVISENDIVRDRAAGYQIERGELRNADWVSPTLNTTADGSLYTNLLDMAKWDAALRARRLLSPGGYQQMWTIVRLHDGRLNEGDACLGWFRTTAGGRALVEHDGAWNGFSAHIVRYLDDDLTVVVLTNLMSDDCEPEEIAHGLAAKYLSEALTSRPEVNQARRD